MEPVIKTYIINVRQFEEEINFKTALDSISPYRRQKISLLKNDKDKNRSLGAAIALNAALKEYGLEERSMEYDLGSQGKPYFRYNPELHFSLSHSGDYAICSMGMQEIGNDIERVRSGRERVADRFFAREELDWIYQTGQSEEIEERIFRIWTMKEAFLKVTGKGMSLPLKDFTIIVSNNNNIQIRHNVNNITYYTKEYTLPAVFGESSKYKISVCSEATHVREELEALV